MKSLIRKRTTLVLEPEAALREVKQLQADVDSCQDELRSLRRREGQGGGSSGVEGKMSEGAVQLTREHKELLSKLADAKRKVVPKMWFEGGGGGGEPGSDGNAAAGGREGKEAATPAPAVDPAWKMYQVDLRLCQLDTLPLLPGLGVSPWDGSADGTQWRLVHVDLSVNHITTLVGLAGGGASSSSSSRTGGSKRNSRRGSSGSRLAGLGGLRSLNLASNFLTRIEGLHHLPELRDLDLADNDIDDLRGDDGAGDGSPRSGGSGGSSGSSGRQAAGGPGGRGGTGGGGDAASPVTTAAAATAARGFRGCRDLRRLNLSGNRLESLEGLSPWLASLRVLHVGGNRLQHLVGLEGLKSLETLHAQSNELSDVAHVGLVPTLTDVDLAENKVDNLGATAAAVALRGKLHALRLCGNPIEEERAYRFRLLDSNRHIRLLDDKDIEHGIREELALIKKKDDLAEIVDETTKTYTSKVELEERRKAEMVKLYKKRIKDVEEAFLKHRQAVEEELKDCVGYAEELRTTDAGIAQSWLASDEGVEEWRRLLREDAAKWRADTLTAERDGRAAQQEEAREEAEAMSFFDKLHTLSLERPAVWQAMKRKELANREEEEKAEARLRRKEMRKERQRRGDGPGHEAPSQRDEDDEWADSDEAEDDVQDEDEEDGEGGRSGGGGGGHGGRSGGKIGKRISMTNEILSATDAAESQPPGTKLLADELGLDLSQLAKVRGNDGDGGDGGDGGGSDEGKQGGDGGRGGGDKKLSRWTSKSFKAKLHSIYKLHSPRRGTPDHVDFLAKKYEGREDEVIDQLEQKYGGKEGREGKEGGGSGADEGKEGKEGKEDGSDEDEEEEVEVEVDEDVIERIEATFQPGPIGLALEPVSGGSAQGVKVNGFAPGSAAEALGTLKPGDRLVAINGDGSVATDTFDQVMDALQAAKRPLTMTLERKTTKKTTKKVMQKKKKNTAKGANQAKGGLSKQASAKARGAADVAALVADTKNDGKKKRGCHITTAVMSMSAPSSLSSSSPRLGPQRGSFDDHGRELTCMRRLRDEHVVKVAPEQVWHYYDTAPVYVALLDRLPAAARRRAYRLLCEAFVLPAVECVEDGCLETAHLIYLELVATARTMAGLGARQQLALRRNSRKSEEILKEGL